MGSVAVHSRPPNTASIASKETANLSTVKKATPKKLRSRILNTWSNMSFILSSISSFALTEKQPEDSLKKTGDDVVLVRVEWTETRKLAMVKCPGPAVALYSSIPSIGPKGNIEPWKYAKAESATWRKSEKKPWGLPPRFEAHPNADVHGPVVEVHHGGESDC